MNLNPYQAFPESTLADAKATADGKRSRSESVVDLRTKRNRWNLRCYLLSGMFVAMAAAVWGVSQILLKNGEFGLEISKWISLILLADGVCCFICGPIAWFWTGQHKRSTIEADDLD